MSMDRDWEGQEVLHWLLQGPQDLHGYCPTQRWARLLLCLLAYGTGAKIKAKCVCSWDLRVISCFQIYSQDQGQQVRLLGIGLFFKTAFFVLVQHWDFTISWTGELGDPQKHFLPRTDAELLLLKWDTQSRGVLWGHLAQTCFCEFSTHW